MKLPPAKEKDGFKGIAENNVRKRSKTDRTSTNECSHKQMLTHVWKTNPPSHAEKHTNYETTEAEEENCALLWQAGGGEMTQHESGTK